MRNRDLTVAAPEAHAATAERYPLGFNFPAWGASLDGWWRWSYAAIDVSTEPCTASLERPR